MKTLVIDFETRWDRKEYTLSKLTTEQYIRDKRFKAFGLCVKELGSDADPVWISHKDITEFVASTDWSSTAVLAHNAQFDVAILAWVYGANPALIFDSLSMARALRGVEVGNSLAKLADEFGLPPKGQAVHSTDGLVELTPEIEKELAEYCAHDTFLCEQVFNRLVDGFPAKELKLIDMTLKMFTLPRLMLDTEMLRQAIDEEERKRGEILGRLGVDDGALASNDRFADLLRRMDVEPPTKLSKTTGRRTYAFAKNDALFQALLNSEREDIALLCEARLKVKSTLERTRAQRFLDIASRGALPVPLNYYGAHTGRWSASRGSGLNLQNLKRGSFLRRSILAPEGHSLVVCDLSQIEPRVLAWVSGYDALLDIFRSGQDAYAAFGAQMFNIPNLSKESHPDLRQSAKSALLGAGYGMGWASFSAQLLTGFLGAPPMMYDKKFAKQVGVTAVAAKAFLQDKVLMKQFEKIPHTCTEEELFYHCLAAKAIIEIYRRAAQPVTDFWALCNSAINHCLLEGNEYNHRCITFRKEEILLPNGMKLRYPDIKVSKEKGVVYGPDETKLYGGKLTENIVQALARIVMTEQMLRIQKRYPIVLTVHDECCIVTEDSMVQEAYDFCIQTMSTAPKWADGIPISCEGGYGKRYGDIK